MFTCATCKLTWDDKQRCACHVRACLGCCNNEVARDPIDAPAACSICHKAHPDRPACDVADVREALDQANAPRCRDGQSVNIRVTPNVLRLELTDEGRGDLLDYVTSGCGSCGYKAADHWRHGLAAVCAEYSTGYQLPQGEILFRTDHRSILSDLLEDHKANGGPELLSEVDHADIGALTSAPVIAYDVERDFSDKAENIGALTNIGAVYWFERYQVESELETLLRQGFVDFPRAPSDEPAEPQPKFTCGVCELEYDNATDAAECEHLNMRQF